MLERDRLYLSKYAIDPEIDNSFDSDEILDYDFKMDKMDVNPDPGTIELDELDEDLWGKY